MILLPCLDVKSVGRSLRGEGLADRAELPGVKPHTLLQDELNAYARGLVHPPPASVSSLCAPTLFLGLGVSPTPQLLLSIPMPGAQCSH